LPFPKTATPFHFFLKQIQQSKKGIPRTRSYRAGKRGSGGTRNEVGRNHLMKSSGCKSRPAKASEQAGSECCHSPGTWWCEAYTARKQAREGFQLRNLSRLRMPTRLGERKAASGNDRNCEGRPGIGRSSLAQGHVSKDFPRTQESSPSPARKSGKTAAKGDRRRPRTDGRAVYDLEFTCEGGKPQASEGAATVSTGGKEGTRWRIC